MRQFIKPKSLIEHAQIQLFFKLASKLEREYGKTSQNTFRILRLYLSTIPTLIPTFY